jgi:hypothetical protein
MKIPKINQAAMNNIKTSCWAAAALTGWGAMTSGFLSDTGHPSALSGFTLLLLGASGILRPCNYISFYLAAFAAFNYAIGLFAVKISPTFLISKMGEEVPSLGTFTAITMLCCIQIAAKFSYDFSVRLSCILPTMIGIFGILGLALGIPWMYWDFNFSEPMNILSCLGIIFSCIALLIDDPEGRFPVARKTRVSHRKYKFN